MKNKRKLALLALVAVPSLIYTAPTTSASAADITGHSKTAYIYDYTYYYNANVSNVVRLISNINDTTSSFQSALDAANKAYDELTETEKQYVTNYSTLSNHRLTRVAYRKLADQIEEKLASVESTSVNYYQNVMETKDWYNTLNAAQKSFVSPESQRILTSYITPNTSIDKVVNKIKLLNSSRITFHQDVADARAELNALRRFSYIYLPVGIEQILLDAEQLVAKDKAAAKEVENAIAALSPKTSTAKDVQAAKTAFEALTPVQQQLVPNVWTLVDFVNGKYDSPNKGKGTKKPILSDTAAVPGKTTAMTKNKNTYTAKINVADTENSADRFVLTTKSNMTVIIPPLGTLLNEDTGVMEISITKKSNRITFQATLNNKPVEFEANMEIIINNLSPNASIVRTNTFGKPVPADYTVEGNRHFIQTSSSASFLIQE
ncbi:hypothetical protein FJQ98_01055 [Lysinibacillus agricola]|uniref:SbsC C-terminal domain-containing protein n=1 Tax=Lysinibacillus agricola TaxID=2590012 RepID=A0ABX7ARZ7_9BACI|nr:MULTISPECIES: hypothetical protein [Lysinibacillus]KOS64518.1 hypothetical protein AN161_01525 [Lysinibacillus sp. FJAT-14222]QQP12735.1 hypothetical protein FJQ98_01055 [Lysinibacillus agricola]